MLNVKNITAGYGAINVLWDLSIRIPKGQLTTIIGPNGAGKTTLLRTIMRMLSLKSGDITLEGESLEKVKSWQMPEKGVVMIPEGRMIFKTMTVEENLMLGAFTPKSRADANKMRDYAYTLFPRLHERSKQLAGTLSGGEAQMLAMGRGLMSNPDVLIIDEPSLGLAPVIVTEIFNILRKLKEQGRTIVLVEQNTHQAIGVADYVYLMQNGKVVLSSAANDISLEEIHNRYFGR